MKSNLQNAKYKILNTQRGITLVALIITVIVLLIFATVSIKLIMNGGIIDKAEKGTQSYSEEEKLEQIKLAVASAKLAGNGFLTAENLNTELKKVFNNEETVSESNDSYKYKNNKTYTINKDGSVGEYKSVLPANYQEVEYIESTGTQYIFIGEVQMSNMIAEIEYPRFPTTGSKNGGMDGTGNIGRLAVGINDSLKYGFNFGNKADNSQVSGDSKRHTYNINISVENKKADLYLDNKYIYSQIADNLSNPLYFTLFAYTGWGKTSPNEFAYCRIYYFELEGQMKLYPCYRKSDNKIGMYDINTGKFYTNQGSGADFIAGPNM